MDSIRITSNQNEQVQIGKEIVLTEKTYRGGKIDLLKREVSSFLPDLREPELSDVLYKTIYYYWAYGASVADCFFYGLFDLPSREIKKYAVLHDRSAFRKHLNNGSTSVFDDKWLTYQRYKGFFGREVICIRTTDDFQLFKDFTEKNPEFVVKPSKLSGGKGVHKESIIERNVEEVFNILISEIDSNKNKFINAEKDDHIIIEQLISQDERMKRLHPSSVNTIRIISVRVDGRVILYEPAIRIGVNNSFVDNMSSGSIIAGVDVETGTVKTKGICKMNRNIEYHPQTGQRILGFVVPEWDALINMTLSLASLAEEGINYVGWDLALSENGWCMVEGNCNADFTWQNYLLQGMKKEFEDLIGWKSNKEFWWQKD